MGFKGDFNIWKDFIKSVKKLDRANKAVSRKPQVRIRPDPEKNRLGSFIDNRKSMGNVKVEKLMRSEINKFKPKRSIDLHGYTRNIDNTLEIFCSKCILENSREILIITGKGSGIVKSATAHWLSSHPELIVGFFEIKDTMMESGAFGVKLRSK